MKENSNFFERILQIIEYKGFRSVNDFSIQGLKYKSSEKINRLKDGKKQPSVEILIDISNMFEEISPAWLLTGKGSMLKEPVPPAAAVPNAELAELAAQIEALKNEIIELQRELINAQKENAKLLKDQAAIKSRQHPATGVGAGKLKQH